jgi:diaminohydroxyphosphoribosylaminopyrimidine deaminase / 5-amino-6-(5-phosphoribosylamino)uracil reductase
MTELTTDDYRFMARALQLAERGRYSAMPNPMVGCVLVRGAEVVGEGWHRKAGEAHAEVVALQNAGGNARSATAYVTLEPCAHEGRTGPCADALIAAGVRRVVAATDDPFPDVAGKGFDKLRAAGIAVQIGLLQAQARRQNRGFFSRVDRGRPFVRLKLAASLDGATAMLSGESQWITSSAARRDVQRLRAESGAILTGIGTVRADDPALTVRDQRFPKRQPLRAIVDSRLSMPADARLLAAPGNTVVYSVADGVVAGLASATTEVVRFAADNGRVPLQKVLQDLGARGINDLLVEAGPALAGSLLTAQLVDELVIYQSPHIMGSETRGLATTPAWTQLGKRLELRVTDRRAVGRDWRITALPGSHHQGN